MKALKWISISLGLLIILAVAGYNLMIYSTKQHSPEETVTFQREEIDLSITYSRPYKKGRDIFGGLVPYGQVWRTGANEPTTLVSKTDISLNGEPLKAGDYTLWTIPGEKEWQLIVNSGAYDWGIGFDGIATRDASLDVLSLTLPALKQQPMLEQFTIGIEEHDGAKLFLAWDEIRIEVSVE